MRCMELIVEKLYWFFFFLFFSSGSCEGVCCKKCPDFVINDSFTKILLVKNYENSDRHNSDAFDMIYIGFLVLAWPIGVTLKEEK